MAVDIVMPVLVAALGGVLITRRTTWARDVLQLRFLPPALRERVIVALGGALVVIGVWTLVEALDRHVL